MMLERITNKEEYIESVDRIYQLMQKDLEVNSAEYEELHHLSILVENYEKDYVPKQPDRRE